MTLVELRNLIERCLADSGAILDRAEIEGRSLTDAEKTKVAGLHERAKSAREHLKAKEASLSPSIRPGEDRSRHTPETRQNGDLGRGGRGERRRETHSPTSRIIIRTAEGTVIESRSHGEPLFDRPEVRDAPSIGDAVLASLGIGETRSGMVSGVAGDGGFLVMPRVGAAFLDLARQGSRLLEAGAQSILMQSAEHVLAVAENSPVPGWRGEGGSVKITEGKIGRLKLSAKSLAARVRVSRELLADAQNAGSIITAMLGEAMSEAFDVAMLTGDAKSNAPTGLLNTKGLSTLDAGGSFTYDSVIDGRTVIENLNVDPVAAMMSPTRSNALSKLKATDGQYLAPPPAFTSLNRLATTAMPNTEALVGNFGTCILGIREQVTIRAVEAGDDIDEGMISIVAHARGDFGCARAERICKISSLG